MNIRGFSILLLDFLLLFAASVVGYALSPSYPGKVFAAHLLSQDVLVKSLLVAAFMAVGLRTFDTRSRKGLGEFAALGLSVLAGMLIGIFAYQLIYALWTATLLDRYAHLITVVVGTIAVSLLRLTQGHLGRLYTRKILFIGSGRYGEEFQRDIAQHQDLGFALLGACYLDTPAGIEMKTPMQRVPEGELLGFCRLHEISDIVVETTTQFPKEVRDSIMLCMSGGVNITELTVFYEQNLELVHTRTLDDKWFWGYYPEAQAVQFKLLKRSIDIILGCIGIVLAVPLVPVIIIAIKASGDGPILYYQDRVGQFNRRFRIVKFRTMNVDAEKDGAVWAAPQDQRTTFVGRWLRKSRLDEIPQFLNILRGEMSFIGPRPERPEMIQKIESQVKFYNYRHLIKPGLSGWAQVNYPYGASVEDAEIKLAYDLYYVKYASIIIDFRILLRTITAMVRGAR